MAYGFEVVDQKHTRTDADIGMTLIGTETESGEGTKTFTYPLESEPTFVFGYEAHITDAPTTDTYIPRWHLCSTYTATNITSDLVENTSGVCLINGDIDETHTTESACITAGGTWDTEHPWFAVFEADIALNQIGKWEDDSCYSTGSLSNLKANTDITLYFWALGLI